LYDSLKQQVLPQLIPPSSRILVAVSGGPDSVALAHVLWCYTQEFREQELSLCLTHVHHGVRRESDDEEIMVKQLAEQWGIPCRIHRFDAKGYAKLSGQSFQTAAREWRYARWQEDMKQEQCTLLATAHHLGDQAETVLYRMLRGSGTAGLAGIYPRKGDVIHPFLSITKEEILEYCRKEDLPYALDYSNNNAIYIRNKIRLNLIPELEREYNPRIKEALGRMAELLRWDEEYLNAEAEKAWLANRLENSSGWSGLRREIFEFPKAILSRLVRRAAGEATGEPRGIGYSYVEQIMASEGRVGWRQNLPGLIVQIRYDGIWFERSVGQAVECPGYTDKCEDQTSCTPLPEAMTYGAWIHWQDSRGQRWKAGLFEDEAFCKDQSEAVREPGEFTEAWEITERVSFERSRLELDKEELSWRKRQAGDKIWYSGVGHKALKKVYQDRKIGEAERQMIPVLAQGEEVYWIPGVGAGDLCRGNSREQITGVLMRQLNSRQRI
jgi:tRNA(Ile)-lysidine synthase